jgi:uncharacterized DUF497 family protein
LNYTSGVDTSGVEFEWDEAKSEACFRERGFDFAYAAFADPGRLVRQDDRHSYGEDRYQLTGLIEGRLFLVVYTTRKSAVRIISARKANSREVKQYENRSHDD